MRARVSAACLGVIVAALACLLPAPARADDSDAALRQGQGALDAHYAQQRAACAQRFFVNDCLHRIEASWRNADAALRGDVPIAVEPC